MTSLTNFGLAFLYPDAIVLNTVVKVGIKKHQEYLTKVKSMLY